MKSKAYYYIMSLTWGLPMTLLGLMVTLGFIIAGYKPKRWRGSIYFVTGSNWGGFSMGPVFICDRSQYKRTKDHEFGHALQNCKYGPFMVIITIMSAIRYHYYKWVDELGKRPKKNYDDIWFEKEATELGTKYSKIIKESHRD